MNILVIDDQCGRLGRKLLESIRKTCPDAHLTAVGTNSMATEYMMNSSCVRCRLSCTDPHEPVPIPMRRVSQRGPRLLWSTL